LSRRTIYIKNAISAEVDRHSSAIEADNSISKIHLTIVLGRRSGMPERVTYTAVTETRLTEDRGLVRMRVNQHGSRT
jgi:hypothetical protein